jgi:deferrochelatase/peroxidase EfeB
MKKFDIDKWSKYPQEKNVIKYNDGITNFAKTKDELEYLISQIENDKKDITGSYDTWLKIGFALADF